MTGKQLIEMLSELSEDELNLPVVCWDDVNFYQRSDVVVDTGYIYGKPENKGRCIKLLGGGYATRDHAVKYGTADDVVDFDKYGSTFWR